MVKLTHEEHAARAMLMGKVYDWRDQTYSDPGTVSGAPSYAGVLDADTLEDITGSVHKRDLADGNWRIFPNDKTNT